MLNWFGACEKRHVPPPKWLLQDAGIAMTAPKNTQRERKLPGKNKTSRFMAVIQHAARYQSSTFCMLPCSSDEQHKYISTRSSTPTTTSKMPCTR